MRSAAQGERPPGLATEDASISVAVMEMRLRTANVVRSSEIVDAIHGPGSGAENSAREKLSR